MYASTQAAWNRIWREEADLGRELETLGYRRSRQRRALYMPILPRQGLILEAGCGVGIEILDLDREGCHPVGVDYAHTALRQLNLFRPGCKLATADIHELPFPNGLFGAYLSFGVLEHFEFGPKPGLVEANRVLRPDGILVLLIPYPNLVWRLAQVWNFLRGRPMREPGFYETTYSLKQLKSYLSSTGFVLLEAHPVGHSFTLWGLKGPFQAKGYYQTSRLAERVGESSAWLFPWLLCFESLLIARKVVSSEEVPAAARNRARAGVV